MALRLHTFIFCTELSFSAILRIAVLLEQRIIAFLICTTSQSESVTPSSTERLLVPSKHRSTRISDNWLITCEPILMLVLRDSLPPIRITSALVRSANSRATSGLMVKNVHWRLSGMIRASSSMVVPPPARTVIPFCTSLSALLAICFLDSRAYTLFSLNGYWNDFDSAPPYTLSTLPFSANSFKSRRMVSSETLSCTLRSDDSTLLCKLIWWMIKACRSSFNMVYAVYYVGKDRIF